MIRNFAVASVLVACCQVAGFSQTIGPNPPPTPTDPEIDVRVSFQNLNPYVNNMAGMVISAAGDSMELKNLVWVWSRDTYFDIKVVRFYQHGFGGEVVHLPHINTIVLNGWIQIPCTTTVTVVPE